MIMPILRRGGYDHILLSLEQYVAKFESMAFEKEDTFLVADA